MNILGILGVMDALRIDLDQAIEALQNYRVPEGRGVQHRVPYQGGEILLIDESYNAGPDSMRAALKVLGNVKLSEDSKQGRRIAILGDMLELGPDEMDLHRAIAKHPALEKIALIHCVGPRMRVLWEILPQRKRGEWHETAGELAARAHLLADAGDVIMVKGSKGSKVSLVVDGLRKLRHPGAADSVGAE